MRNKTISAGILLPIIVCFASCTGSGHNTSVSVTDTESKYEFAASYPRNKTERVQVFINNELSPNRIFGSVGNAVELNTILTDQTRIQLKSREGKIQIRLNKSENSPASLERIKKLCEGIKQVLVEQRH